MTRPSAGLRGIGAAKAALDRGFSRIGKDLDPGDPVHLALAARASGAIGLSNSAALVVRQGLVAEAAVLVDRLLELSVEARWVAAGESRRRAFELAQAGASLWPRAELAGLMGSLGFPGELVAALGPLWDTRAHGGAGHIPWGHRFDAGRKPGLAGEDLLHIAALAMGQVLMALDSTWGGLFPPGGPGAGAEERSHEPS